MTSFCTAVVVEVIGSITVLDTNIVKRILPYVVSGLQYDAKGDPDHKVSFNVGCLHVAFKMFSLFLI